ncbi:hypothetical protein XBKB1_3370005 [Xenorhabdus bovienii str. kraussei Becker Underwood]|uniref:Uncharacterized protein n=1 Tax=Xenorhabdus bovienii str. kraussei Becker Underwood TaxID=1398204 RepID=A0A077PV59_XENBV|nr:hypothetical protein XBKB1_3370005 [Xenorhabdus bovienii str. kraussei Becker Underwood]
MAKIERQAFEKIIQKNNCIVVELNLICLLLGMNVRSSDN